MPREWDAGTYDRIPLPHERWGAAAIARLKLKGDERVMDAGCGTGRVTERLLTRLPGGHVVALDGSRAMLRQLQQRLAHSLDQLEIVQADLTRPLPALRPVDAILSTATLHWLPDHASLFRHLFAVLNPGGQLVAECGGAGNIAAVNTALRSLGRADDRVWNFATADETRYHLRAAGFTDVDVWLEPDPVRLLPGEPLETYLRTVVLGAHLDATPEPDRPAFARAVADALPEPVIDYVRLNIVAWKPGAA